MELKQNNQKIQVKTKTMTMMKKMKTENVRKKKVALLENVKRKNHQLLLLLKLQLSHLMIYAENFQRNVVKKLIIGAMSLICFPKKKKYGVNMTEILN